MKHALILACTVLICASFEGRAECPEVLARLQNAARVIPEARWYSYQRAIQEGLTETSNYYYNRRSCGTGRPADYITNSECQATWDELACWRRADLVLAQIRVVHHHGFRTSPYIYDADRSLIRKEISNPNRHIQRVEIFRQ